MFPSDTQQKHVTQQYSFLCLRLYAIIAILLPNFNVCSHTFVVFMPDRPPKPAKVSTPNPLWVEGLPLAHLLSQRKYQVIGRSSFGEGSKFLVWMIFWGKCWHDTFLVVSVGGKKSKDPMYYVVHTGTIKNLAVETWWVRPVHHAIQFKVQARSLEN